MGSAGGGSSARPSWTRAGGDLLANGLLPNGATSFDSLRGTPGFMGDLGSQADFPIEQLFAGLGGLSNSASMGGDAIRQSVPGAYGQSSDFIGNLFGGAQGAQGDLSSLMGMLPGFMDAASGFGQSINNAQGQFGNAFGAANQTLSNVMNPTAYNPLFKNAYENQVLPELRSNYASRGLVGGGSAIQGESEAARDLSDQFAQRQFGEQLQSQQTLGQLASQSGSLGATASMIPSASFAQFMQGLGGGANAMSQMGNLAGLPLEALGGAANAFNAGLQMPMQTASNLYGLTRTPLESLASFINGVPNISGGTKGFLSSLFS
jgi:hypothetical protein